MKPGLNFIHRGTLGQTRLRFYTKFMVIRRYTLFTPGDEHKKDRITPATQRGHTPVAKQVKMTATSFHPQIKAHSPIFS